MDINADHFRILRLAIYRRLTCEQISETLFTVTSSREGHPPYTVDVHAGCPCDSTLPCSHLALARDRWFEREAEMTARMDYIEARWLDFGSLCVRPGLCGDDRRFVKVCVERAREKYAHLFVTPKHERVTTF